MTKEERTKALKEIRDEVIALKSSPLYQYRVENKNFPVLGEGSHEAKIMFVGEAPGKNEAQTGRPFCGAAGKILDDLLAANGIKREEVYITNIVKDRPPGNRDPSPEEIALYGPFLLRQIAIIQPKIIATLGRFSMAFVFNRFGLSNVLRTISQIHGRVFEAEAFHGELKVVPLHHPAATIYHPVALEFLQADFKHLTEILRVLQWG